MAHILDNKNNVIIIKKGKSCNITGTFVDMSNVPILKASLLSFTITLFDKISKSIINSRNAQTVLDANGGIVNSDGTFKIELGPLDNVIKLVSPPDNYIETHLIRLEWTWDDGDGTRYSGEELEYEVINWVTPT